MDAPIFHGEDSSRLALVEVVPEGKDIRYTRAEFLAACYSIAAALSTRQIGQGDIVLISLKGIANTAICFWACVLLRAKPLIYPIKSPQMLLEVYKSNIDNLIKQIQIKAVISNERAIFELLSGNVKLASGFDDLAAEADSAPAPPVVDFSDLDIVHLQASSGTTGQQKIIPLTHRNVLDQIAIFSEALHLTPEDSIANWMPLYHDAGLLFTLYLPFLQGIPTILLSPGDWVVHPALLFEAIDRYKATLTSMPNFGFKHCARRIREQRLDGLSLDSIRLFLNGSERVYWDSMNSFYERFKHIGVKWENLAVSYGLAEATLVVTHTPFGESVFYDPVDETAARDQNLAEPASPASERIVKYASCGVPLRSVEIGIWDEQGNSLPDRHIGEVALKSVSLFNGYYQRPDLDETCFENGWFLTGDMGYMFDGQLFITGRKKDLIITGGKNIYPADIEEVVSNVPGVRPGRTVVFGVHDEREGTDLITVVAEVYSSDTREHASIALAIREAIAQQTPVVASFVQVTHERWVVKTSSGKISRRANKEKWLAERADL